MRITLFGILYLFSLSIIAQNWQSLGSGANSGVWVFYTDTASNSLYVGGNFGYADNLDVNGIARWDGTAWDSLGSGITGCTFMCLPVKAIAKYNGEIYAGGSFPNMGGIPNRIAKWDGNNWSDISGGVQGIVSEFMVYNNELYVGGTFDTAGTVAANGLAKWNGTQWSDVYGLPNYFSPNQNSIMALEVYNGELYVAGNFSDTGGYRDIVKYDGANWVPLENGILGGIGGINTMVVYKGELYVGGLFYKSAGNVDDNIMKWNGSNWSEVAGGVDPLNGQVYDMIVYNGELYVVGEFLSAGGVPANRIAKWDGTEWCGLGSSFDNTILAVGVLNNMLYIGGGFWTIDGDSISRIAKWTGGSYVDTCGAIIGVEQLTINDEQITVYPNPARSQLSIKGNIDIPATFELYDITGRKVKQEAVGNGSIDVSSLAKGLYVWQIKTPDVSVRGKFIKQ